MYGVNRLVYLYLGSIGLLFLVFIWVAFALNFTGLDNIFVKLSNTTFAGYYIPELLGSNKNDSVGDMVLCLKISFSLVLVGYSLYFLALFSIDEDSKRIGLLFLGFSIPLLILVLFFWNKFIKDNHIVDAVEKRELFIATASCIIISVICYAFSSWSLNINRPKAKKYGTSTKVASKNPDFGQARSSTTDQNIEEKPLGKNKLNAGVPVEAHHDTEIAKLEKLPQLEEILNSDSGEKDGVENVEMSDEKESENQQDIVETQSHDNQMDNAAGTGENPTPPSSPSNTDMEDDSKTGDLQKDSSLKGGTSEKE